MLGINFSRLGRLLRGLGDSATALATSGTSVNVTRVLVFALSASSVSGGVAVAGGAVSGPVGRVATDVQPVAGPRLELYVR